MYVHKKQLTAASEKSCFPPEYMRGSTRKKENGTAGRSRIDEKSAGSFLGQTRTSLTASWQKRMFQGANTYCQERINWEQ
jgi:hypothetical protein